MPKGIYKRKPRKTAEIERKPAKADRPDAMVSISMADRKLLDELVSLERNRTGYALSIKVVIGRAIRELYNRVITGSK